MMNRYFYIALAAMTALTGCKSNDEADQHYDNKLFISGTGFAKEVRIEENVAKISQEVTLRIGKLENFDVTASFRAAPELLDTYRAAYYDADALLLPESCYDLSAAQAAIPAGRVASESLRLEFINLDRLDLDRHYVLPVTIATANMDLLQRSKTVYYVFKEASLVNMAANLNNNWLWPEWKDASPVTDMRAFTLEALVFGQAFKNASSISTIMGIEDIFLIRVGDVTKPVNQLEVAYAIKGGEGGGTILRGNVSDASLGLKTGRWYHVAVTFDNGLIKVYLDGRERASGNSNSLGMTSVNFGVEHSDESDGKPRCFWIGYSYDENRFLDGMIAEARIWNKALTVDEINSEGHFYKVSPDSQGLVAYWRFDEGDGKTVKDHTSYGNDLTSKANLQWVPVSLPVKEPK